MCLVCCRRVRVDLTVLEVNYPSDRGWRKCHWGIYSFSLKWRKTCVKANCFINHISSDARFWCVLWYSETPVLARLHWRYGVYHAHWENSSIHLHCKRKESVGHMTKVVVISFYKLLKVKWAGIILGFIKFACSSWDRSRFIYCWALVFNNTPMQFLQKSDKWRPILNKNHVF